MNAPTMSVLTTAFAGLLDDLDKMNWRTCLLAASGMFSSCKRVRVEVLDMMGRELLLWLAYACAFVVYQQEGAMSWPPSLPYC